MLLETDWNLTTRDLTVSALSKWTRGDLISIGDDFAVETGPLSNRVRTSGTFTAGRIGSDKDSVCKDLESSGAVLGGEVLKRSKARARLPTQTLSHGRLDSGPFVAWSRSQSWRKRWLGRPTHVPAVAGRKRSHVRRHKRSAARDVSEYRRMAGWVHSDGVSSRDIMLDRSLDESAEEISLTPSLP